MPLTLKPIETVYRGYRFRSRLEARWAVFFDALGIRWEYEKEGYDLGPAGWYLPDFWLPEHDCWFEVKAGWPDARESEVARQLATTANKRVYVSIGPPMTSSEVLVPWRPHIEEHTIWQHRILHYAPNKCEAPWDDACWWTVCLDCGARDIGLWGYVEAEHHNDGCRWEAAGRPGGDHSALVRAVLAARQARFEHGEIPRT